MLALISFEPAQPALLGFPMQRRGRAHVAHVSGGQIGIKPAGE
jgi:hypothetical protein